SETIRAGPDNSELLPYLDSINRLKDANDALGRLDLDSAKQSRREIHELLKIGLGNLSQLFSQWLKQQSGGVDPAAYTSATEIPTFPTDTVKLLSMLATYLNLVNDEVSYDLKLTKTYASIRTRHLQKSLAQFSDMCMLHIKSNSVDGSNKAMAQQGYAAVPGAGQSSSAESRFCSMRNENWYETGTSPFVQYTANIVKVFEAERDLVRQIMPTIISQETFQMTIGRPFESYLNTGDKMTAYFASAPLYEILQALDIYGRLLDTEGAIDALFAQSTSQRNAFSKLLARLQTPLNKCFAALITLLRNPSRDSIGQKQTGGVHELVFNTLTFLNYLILYKDLLIALIVPLGDGHWARTPLPGITGASQPAGDPNDGLAVFQHYLRDVIDALASTIEQASKQMKRAGLEYVFLINNYSYLARALRDTMNSGSEGQALGLGDLVGRSPLTRIEARIESSRKPYAVTWTSPTNSFMSASLSTGEKLSLFNREFEDILRGHRSFEVFDADVRAVLISDAIEAILPTYEGFLKQIPDKGAPDVAHVFKYRPKDIQRRIQSMWDE
ncbi:exocyst complex component exo70, partial [Linderina pennispora]